MLQCAGRVGGGCCSSRHDVQGNVRGSVLGSIRFSKHGGGEGTELAAVAHANEKAALPVEFHGVGRQMMAFARAAVLNVGTQAARVIMAMCCGVPPVLAEHRSHCEGFRLLSQLSVDVRVSRDVKRNQMSRNRGSLGAPVGNVWWCDAVAKRLPQFGGLQLAVDTAPRVHTARRWVATQTCSRRGRSCAW